MIYARWKDHMEKLGFWDKYLMHILQRWYDYHGLIQGKKNKATRSPEISREQVQKLTPQFLLYIYWI